MARKATERQTETPPEILWAADGGSVYFSNVILANSFMALGPLNSVSLSLVICLMTSFGMVSMSAWNVVPLSVPASHARSVATTLSFHLPSFPQSSRLSTPTNQSGEGAIMAMTETLEYKSLAVMIMVLVAAGGVLSPALNTLNTYPPFFAVLRSLYSVASSPD